MIKRRLLRWSLIVVTLAAFAAFAVWLEPTRVVWGWLRGEAFYQGRPTSWWRQELVHWGIVKQTIEKIGAGDRFQVNLGGIIAELPAAAKTPDGGPIQESVTYSLAHAPRQNMLDWVAANVFRLKRDGLKASKAFLEPDFGIALGELQADSDPDVRAKADVIASHRAKSKE